MSPSTTVRPAVTMNVPGLDPGRGAPEEGPVEGEASVT
jgi:hypothetical protein